LHETTTDVAVIFITEATRCLGVFV